MSNSEHPALYDLTLEQLTTLLASWGLPTYRARQIWEWLYKHFAGGFDEMTTLPGSLRERLAAETTLAIGDVVLSQKSSDGQTKKILFRLPDGQLIETVLMRYEKRRTLCISTQAGCAMGCVFCATGQMGFKRNLTVAEIVGQVMYFARELAAEGQHVTNIVLMGMGEPLHNYEATVKALAILTHPLGLAYPPRRITLSTVGLVPEIIRLGQSGLGVNLAVSLHAATDELRDRLVPINRRYPLKVLMAALRTYPLPPRRRITFEYVLIDGVNDRPEDAGALVRLLRGLRCKVNLLPLNEAPDIPFRRPSQERVQTFQHILKSAGILATIRESRGLDISAACGLLATEPNQKRLDTAGRLT